ncbi:Synerg-CTERM sorting domain-containing protein [Cloacibacillus evryensis]|uniref:Synerg-CTERM sorting domain-containing protein n=1 Tax=Cloacibacillus evryensis TaxID=508460 RepID=UPI0004BA9F59|nr:Synerg-CTERM sorting domain-containing protein [Cloacibacillus evryensis]
MKKLLVLMLAAVLLAVMAAGAMAAVIVSPNYVYDASFDLKLTQDGVSDIECDTYQYSKEDINDEGDKFYAGLPNPGSYSGGEILSVFTVYGVISPDLVDAVYYSNVPAAIGDAAGSLYLYFVNEDFTSSDLTTKAVMSVSAKYDADKKMLAVKPLPSEIGKSFWQPDGMGTRLILVKGTGDTPTPTPDPTGPVVTSADFKAQSAVSSDVKFGYEGASFDVIPGPDGYGTEEEVTASNITTGLPDNTKAISLLTSFSMALYDEENDEYLDGKVSGDVALKFQLDPGVTVPEGASLYALIPVYESVFRSSPLKSAQKSSALAAGDGVKFSAFPAEYDKDTKTVTFTANGIYDEAAVVLAAVTAEETPTPDPEPTPSGSSSSGCSAGFGALALLALAPLMIRRKK